MRGDFVSSLFLYARKEETHIFNQFVLNVDLKRLYTSDTPKFRRGDSVIILFNFYDDGEEFNINSATKAQVHQKTSKGNVIVTDCSFTTHKGKRVVKFEVEDVAMVEIGYLNLLLTVYSGDEVISIQPFNVLIYDDYMGGAASFIELIQELQRMIENMAIDLNNAIKIPEKGQPNGVASLDEDGKIYLNQMPKEFQGFIDHITQTVFEHRVHGFTVDDNGMGMYETPNGDWQYIGFPPDIGGGSATQLVDATITVKDGKATVTYEGIPTVVSNKWFTGDRKVEYFLLNGTSFTGNSFNVSSLGTHTLYYKDSNGTEYVKTFNVTSEMMGKPAVDIDIDDGYVTVTIPPTTNVTVKKWDKGSRDVAYFKYNGTTFTGNTFQVTEIGTYTIYVKTVNGLEYVYVFEVTQDMLSIISKPQMYDIDARYTHGYSDLNFNLTVIDEFYKITKHKPIDSMTYVNLTSPIEANTAKTTYFLFVIDTSLSSNKNKVLSYGYENEIGQQTELKIYIDSNYVYFWFDNETEATLLRLTDTTPLLTATTVSFPNSIVGKSITTIGTRRNAGTFQQNNTVKTVNIPMSIKKLNTIFYQNYTVETVNVANPNMEFIDDTVFNSYPFASSEKTVTFKALSNSTTKDFVQSKNNPKFKFQAT